MPYPIFCVSLPTKRTINAQYLIMDKILLYYNYDASLAHYEESQIPIKQGQVKGQKNKIIAKPVLMLAVLKAIEDGIVTSNMFDYDKIKDIYEKLFSKYFLEAHQTNLTPMYYPWYYMNTDGFWKLAWKSFAKTTSCPGEKWIHDNVSHAYFEDDLWVLVQNRKYRKLLMEFIIEKKIRVAVEQEEKGFMAAEGRWLKSLLMLLAM